MCRSELRICSPGRPGSLPVQTSPGRERWSLSDSPVPWTDPVLGLDTHIVSIGVRGQQLQGRNRISRAGWDPGDSVNGASEGRKHVACLFTSQRVFGKRVGGGQRERWGSASPSPSPVPTGLLACGLVRGPAFSQFIYHPPPAPSGLKPSVLLQSDPLSGIKEKSCRCVASSRMSSWAEISPREGVSEEQKKGCVINTSKIDIEGNAESPPRPHCPSLGGGHFAWSAKPRVEAGETVNLGRRP